MQRQKISFAVLALIGAVKAKSCPFGHGGQASSEGLAQVETTHKVEAVSDAKSSDYTYSSELFAVSSKTCVAKTVSGFATSDYEEIVTSINNIYEATDATVEDNNNPRAEYAGCILRMAGHDFMDYRVDTGLGGSDGCINFHDEDNTGIVSCVQKFGLIEAYEQYCDKVSLADWMVIAGEAVMGRTATDYSSSGYYNDGQLAQVFRDNFKAGRTTDSECSWNVGFMPNPDNGCQGENGLQDIFVDNIYATSGEPWALTAAINGVHTIGRANPENSGFDGYWSEADQQGVFNNDYYRSLLLKGWGPEQQQTNGKFQWNRIDKGVDDNHREMVLDTDMCMVYKTSIDYAECLENDTHSNCKGDLDTAVEIHGYNGNCCGWVFASRVFLLTDLEEFEFCGVTLAEGESVNRRQCCDGEEDDSYGNCDSAQTPQGVVYDLILKYLEDESFWLEKYQKAWWFATENGYADGELWYLNGSTDNQLEAFDCNAEFTDRTDCIDWHPDCEWINQRTGCALKSSYD